MGNKILYRIRVYGFVQGVGFRWNAAREARRIGIAGHVRNMPDGSVYIEAEGSREQLEKFTEWCREGPGYVESVETESSVPVNYRDFKIIH
ncbi:MAG TPA: acylphosphatase [Bacteroidales bacterium]|jgi:acylphosphatase|nr:acylphosphatase [Bacteroidales bacterium]HOS73184.1 acylphosphatase [Bacteroidales bacterium]HQH23739.1 acylphosphatase [Bacteroidales bacterium]HQJ83410.1 acylphosphatase [Bacteroidales bacterium]